MSESVSLLRVYFILAGAMGAYQAFGSLTAPGAGSVETVDGWIGILIAAGLVAAGVMLPYLLQRRIIAIRVVIFLNLAFQAIAVMSILASGMSVSALVFPIVLLLLTWYLLVSINRLAARKVV